MTVTKGKCSHVTVVTLISIFPSLQHPYDGVASLLQDEILFLLVFGAMRKLLDHQVLKIVISKELTGLETWAIMASTICKVIVF